MIRHSFEVRLSGEVDAQTVKEGELLLDNHINLNKLKNEGIIVTDHTTRVYHDPSKYSSPYNK